jgi:uncharacterized repeat protein (TIGR03803 family)
MMRTYVLCAAFLLLLIPSAASADCPTPSTRFFFINGINSEPEEARLPLQNELRKGIVPGSVCPLTVASAENHTYGFVADLCEAALQKGILGPHDRCLDALELLHLEAVGKLSEEFIDELRVEMATVIARHRADLNAQLALFRTALEDPSNSVVVVAHSQGNLFANESLLKLLQERGGSVLERFAIVSVATPASEVVGGGKPQPYVTLADDPIRHVPDSLAPNLPPGKCGFELDMECHRLVWYLTFPDSSDEILRLTQNAIGLGTTRLEGSIPLSPYVQGTDQTIKITGSGFVANDPHKTAVLMVLPGRSIVRLTDAQIERVDDRSVDVKVTLADPGVYSAQVIDASGKRSNVLGFVVQDRLPPNQLPAARFSASDGTSPAVTSCSAVLALPNQPCVLRTEVNAATGEARVTFTDASSDPDGVIQSRIWRADTQAAPLSIGERVFTWGFQPGTYRITLTVTDDDGESSGATATIVVDAPPLTEARDDAYQVGRGGAIAVSSPGILANDAVGAVAGVAVEFLEPLPAAALRNTGGGGFSLDLASNPTFVGTMVLKYIIHTGSGDSNVAQVGITVAEPSFRYGVVASLSAATGQTTSRLTETAAGTLYGIAQTGGAFGMGSIFRVTTAGVLSTLHSFQDQPWLGGLTRGADASLYGTTAGGSFGDGALFFVTGDGTFVQAHSFDRSVDGQGPSGGLVRKSDGTLLGLTTSGGNFGAGTLFRVDVNDTVSVVAHLKDAIVGPIEGVVLGPDGALYGSTSGTSGNQGTIFRVGLDGTVRVLYRLRPFDSALGYYPDGVLAKGSLVSASDGNLYGVATYGGRHGGGTAFKVTLDGRFQILHDFDTSVTGAKPWSALVEGTDGKLYGSAAISGAREERFGTLFRLTTSGALEVLHRFSGTDGDSPTAPLTLGTDGSFYGSTFNGGLNNHGVIFQLRPR